jgi:hypothetical protein
MASTNKLYFEILPTLNCKTLALADMSTYAGDVEGATLQVQLPDRETVKELLYKPNSITILNSNSLGYSNVTDLNDLEDLPDGVYTIKISVCPYEINWFERDIYRICKLECKYYKALLTLDMSKCESCFSKQKMDKLNNARVYMEGVIANTNNGDINKASELYEVADKILDNLIECDC